MHAIGSLAGGRPVAVTARPSPGALGACGPGEGGGMTSSRHALQRPTQQLACHRQQQQQQQQPRLVSAAAAPPGSEGAAPQLDFWGQPIGAGEIGFVGDPDDYELVRGAPDAIEGKAGYTPYGVLQFTDIPLKHEVAARVEKPVSEVYALWSDRLNWPEWFSMIEEVGFAEGEQDVCALNMWYRWAMTPWLELYVALRRTQAEPNKHIVEEPEDGAPITAAVLFAEDGPAATVVTLRVAYLLPVVLHEFAGQLAVYGDVDRKLQASMQRMKEWVEGADAAAEAAGSAERMAAIRAELPDRLQEQAEYDAQWEQDKARQLMELRQRRRAAEAAADAQHAADDAEAAAVAAAAVAEAKAAAVAAAAAAPASKRRGPRTKAEKADAAPAPKAGKRARKPTK